MVVLFWTIIITLGIIVLAVLIAKLMDKIDYGCNFKMPKGQWYFIGLVPIFFPDKDDEDEEDD